MFISIVTVVFNGEKTIERTIKSVLGQNFTDYEYIIQDGCSNDNTLKIANSYEELFKGKLHIYSEKDKGIYDAMNKGIKKAKGDYIWIVNADDWMTENALQDIYSFYIRQSSNNNLIIAGGINLIDEKSGTILKKSTPTQEDYPNRCKKLTMGVCHPASVIARNIYQTVGLYDAEYKISGDIDFILRCYFSKIKVKFTNEIYSNMSNGGVSNEFLIKKCFKDYRRRTDKFCKNSFKKYYLNVKYLFRIITLRLLSEFNLLNRVIGK